MATISTVVTENSPIPKDIFNKGNLVIFKRGDNVKTIVCVEKDIDSFTFSGQVMVDRTMNNGGRGEYRNNWVKSIFTQFYGTITIESVL